MLTINLKSKIKLCPKCGEEKPFDGFSKDKSRKGGLAPWCRRCKKEDGAKYRAENNKKEKERCAKYRANPENKEKERKAKYYKKNKKWMDERQAEYRAATRKQRKKYEADPKNKTRRNKQTRYRYHHDASFNTLSRCRVRLKDAYQHYSTHGKCKTSDELGINYQAIIKHLGPCPGPREDYNIDHIKPCCLFDFNDEAQARECFAPENHQWLTKKQNLEKSNTYPWAPQKLIDENKKGNK